MKTLLFCLLCGYASAGVEENPRFLARTGGFVEQPQGVGTICFVVPEEVKESVQSVADEIERVLRFPCTVTNATLSSDIFESIKPFQSKDRPVVVGYVDNSALPSLLVAPETLWAIVNLDALKADKPEADILSDRIKKETWRAFGFVLGAAHSDSQICVMKPVASPQDLDNLPAKVLSPEPFNRIYEQAALAGILPIRRITYRKAVEEGWAAAPTNAYQQAIWDEVKDKKAE